MVAGRKPVIIHYRKYDRLPAEKLALESLVRAGMNTVKSDGAAIKDRYLSRLRNVGSDSFFINTYHDVLSGESMVFGDILHFTKGHLQALCQTADEKAASVPVQQMKAPEQTEYVHSQLFWMIKDDHVFVIQSLSLRTPDLEEYLDWLLKQNAGILRTSNPLILKAKFDEDAVGGDLEDIQEIIVGGVATPTLSVPADNAIDERSTDVVSTQNIDTGGIANRTIATEILKVLLGGDANVNSLMATVPADAELNVKVHIGYQTKKRKVDRVALSQLETGLRNLPDSQLAVRAKGTSMAIDGTVRLHHTASIKLIKALDGNSQIIGSLLDPQDVLRAMTEAYTTFVANGKIPSSEQA